MSDAVSARPWTGLLLSGLAGRTVRVQGQSGDGPDPRPILTDHHLLLPPSHLADADAPIARAAVAHAAAHLRHSPSHRPTTGLKPMSVAVVSALEDARVERLAMAEMPGLQRWWAPFHALAADDGDDLGFGAFLARLSSVLFDPRRPSRSHWIDKGRELFERQAAADLGDVAAFRRIGSVLANDLGQMRVRYEPQAYRVWPAYRDDNTYLWTPEAPPEQPPPDTQSLEATPELATLAIRTVQAQPDADGAEPPPEIELGRYRVPEWDHRRELLKRDWCTVIETVPFSPARPAGTRRAPAPPRARAAAALLNRARRLRRQFEGDELDLDAAIDAAVDRRLDRSPDARLFRRPGRGAPATSVLVLLDLSASANDRLPGAGGCSVLALEQQAAMRLVESTVRSPRRPAPRIAIHGFSSDTRARVGYQRLLDFGQPFDDAAAGRILSARARHSTRLGAALRHATRLLQDETAEVRTLLLVTDGAPSDIDVFDSRYLVEDARKAVLDARRLGIQVHCLTLDPTEEPQARRIFGWRHYRIVADPVVLASHLSRVQARALLA